MVMFVQVPTPGLSQRGDGEDLDRRGASTFYFLRKWEISVKARLGGDSCWARSWPLGVGPQRQTIQRCIN